MYFNEFLRVELFPWLNVCVLSFFCCYRFLRVLTRLTRHPKGPCEHHWMIPRSSRFFEIARAAWREICLGCAVALMFGSPKQIVVQPERSI